jgi:Tol biopolymer transport system component/imidazolonepropionase-like amidohydrolase
MCTPTLRAAAVALLLALSAPLRVLRGGGGGGLRELPLQPARTLRFTTDEGTWTSLDLSPDGRVIVFDLLGDLYTLPLTGGKATRITSGMAFDGQPRFSPDGKSIVYVSDRSGSENLWVMDAEGRNPRQLTRLEKRQFVSPEWTPDGRYVVVSRNNALFAPQYDLYLHHRDGGTGVKMTGQPARHGEETGPGAPSRPNNFVGADFGADGRYVWVAAREGTGGYNQTSFGWQVALYDRETGELSRRTNAFGGGMRPVVSPDGRWLVYATRDSAATSLRVRDLRSGDERWLRRDVQRDDQESRFTRDLMPGSDFTPDSRYLVTSWGGKMWKVAVPSGEAVQIPFTADVEQQMGALSQFEYALNDSTLTVRQIRGARPSPDGRRLAFTALDRLWVMDLPGGTPRRLTTLAGQVGEHSPVWSPDGRWIAYVTWTEEGGDVYRVRADGRGGAERLTRQRAFYRDVNYTPDGTRLVALRGPRQPRIEEERPYGMELVWLPASGGEVRTVAPVETAGFPHFTRDGERIYITVGREGLVSMRFDGTDRRPVLRVTGYEDARRSPPRPTPADEILISPTGERALAMVDNHVYVVSVPQAGGDAPTVSVANPQRASVPVRQLTRVGGDFAGWSPGGERAFYSIGHSFFTYDLARAEAAVRDSTARADSLRQARAAGARVDTAQAGLRPGQPMALTDSAAAGRGAAVRARPAYEPERLEVLITVRKDRPRGTVVLRGGRVVTMRGAEVIERGDVVVTDNRIVAVGPTGSVTVPAGARVIDVAGKTLIPGLVDVHAHLRPPFGIHTAQPWEYLANLAYGVTTTRDPQTGSTDVLSYGDLVEAGEILGPRIFSTGPGVFWSDDIKSLDDARDVLRRYTDFYDTRTIKQYMVGDRKVRQWVVMAARELGLTPTLEGGLDFKKNLTEAVDGYAGIEHSLPIAPLYQDAVRLLAESGTTYTPTLLVQYGGPWAENYWYQRYDILRDPKLRRFTPAGELARRGFRRPGWWHESQYSFRLLAEQADKIVRAGGRVGIGGHGQLQGLGVHWELWTVASGGMRPHDALRMATRVGAEAIGLGKELGSIEPGKLADVLVLDADPLEDLQNTDDLRYVMKNGRLYEAETLSEVWPRQRPLPPTWWTRGEPPLQ